MTVSMSDDEYAVLVDAAKWIGSHSGVGLPEYPGMQTLGRVVAAIDQRRTAEGAWPASQQGREAAGDLRDEKAAERDRQATIRDSHADERDTRAILHGEPDDPDSMYRERRMGASDRDDSALDRQLSKTDRAEAAGDRKAAGDGQPADPRRQSG